jgi:hypothetical protein
MINQQKGLALSESLLYSQLITGQHPTSMYGPLKYVGVRPWKIKYLMGYSSQLALHAWLCDILHFQRILSAAAGLLCAPLTPSPCMSGHSFCALWSGLQCPATPWNPSPLPQPSRHLLQPPPAYPLHLRHVTQHPMPPTLQDSSGL